MKFVIQRVLEGHVKVNGQTVGKINKGLVVLIGFTQTDKSSDIKFAANKLLNMRLWDDDSGARWKECVKSKNYEILLVSQFTLYSILKGNKPDFHKALEPDKAMKLYNAFVENLRSIYIAEKIQTGLFGEMMEVSLINDGPVTINWEYPELEEKKEIIDGKSQNTKNEGKNSKKDRKKHDKSNFKQDDELQEFNSTKNKNKNFSSECFPKSQEKDTGELEKINTIINTDNSDENIKIIEQISIDVEKSI